MSTTIRSRLDETSDPGSAGAERSEPVGRAQRRAGAARREAAPRAELAEEVKALLPDGLIAMAAARITFSSPARRGRRTTRLPRGRAQHAVPASGDGGLT